MSRILAAYPIGVAAFLLTLPILAPRSGPLALASILSLHLTLAAVGLVPIALAVRHARWLRIGLLVLAGVALLRFGGEWASLPPGADEYDDVVQAATWNLELGSRAGADAVDGLRDVDVDVVALQELGPDHAAAIAASPNLLGRFPAQELHPEPGVLGIGLLSRGPILRAEHTTDPSLIEAVVDIAGRQVTVITAHPLPGRISMAGPLPVAFDASERDRALQAIRARVDAAIGRGESVVVLGDFNVAPDEPGYRDLVAGLHDAHAEVGQGPGWTWRPSRFEGTGIGLLADRPGALRTEPASSSRSRALRVARRPLSVRGVVLARWCEPRAAIIPVAASRTRPDQGLAGIHPGHDRARSRRERGDRAVRQPRWCTPGPWFAGAHADQLARRRLPHRDVRARVTRSGSDLLVTIDTFVPGDGGCTLEGIESDRSSSSSCARSDPARICVVAS